MEDCGALVTGRGGGGGDKRVDKAVWAIGGKAGGRSYETESITHLGSSSLLAASRARGHFNFNEDREGIS